ncbi:MAG: c-type cytochrome [Acetobacteraceae bacterium]|nr:c-type cytochrome [Acetobacteraceae bacterium]
MRVPIRRGNAVRQKDVRYLLTAVWLGLLSSAAMAQTEGAPALDGAALFKQQCSACHTLNAADPPRQGPTLAGVYGRKAGTVPGYKYSAGFQKTDVVWDETHLDAYLTNPQSVIPGSMMPYKQSKAPVRKAIIAFLKEQH